jgi:hypothetical protein
MAYSKTPQFNSHQLVRLPVSGTQYPHGTLEPTVGMRYVNCVPRNIERLGTDPEHVLIKRPGLVKSTVESTVTDPYYYRGCGSAHGLDVFAKGNSVFYYANSVALFTLVDSASAHPVYFEEATLAGVRYIIALEERGISVNSRLHVYNYDTITNTTIDLGFKSTGAPVFINGYIFIAQRGTHRIYNSEVGALTTWTLANNFIDAEMHGDAVVTLAKHRNHLVALGRNSIEFFYDGAVEVGSPLVRQETYSTEVGMWVWPSGNVPLGYMPGGLWATIGDSYYFLGRVGKSTSTSIYRIKDFKIEKLSTPYLDNLLNSDLLPATVHFSVFRLDYWGEPCAVFSLIYTDTSPALTQRFYFAYHSRENLWTQLNFPTTEGSATNLSILFGGVSGNVVYGHDSSITTVFTVSTDPTKSVDASWTTDFFDGGVDSMKHFKYVDVLGSIGDLSGNNTITLSYCKDYIPYTFTSATTISRVADQFYTTRFRNLGRARRISLRVSIAGTAPIAIKGLDIAYNLGVY